MGFASRILRKLSREDSTCVAPRPQFEVLEDRRLLSATVSATPKAVIVGPPIVVLPLAQPHGVGIHSEAGEKFTGIIGRVDGLGNIATGSTVNNLRAVVDWGDGTPLDKTATLYKNSAGTIAVAGSHTYAAAGKFKITIKVQTIPPVLDPPTALIAPLTLATIVSSMNVVADTEGGVHLKEVATQKFSAVVGTFEFQNVDLALHASIDWGDGTSSVGTLIHTPGRDSDDWSVVGTHTFKFTGVYKVHVGVTARPIGAGGGPLPQFVILLKSINSTIDVKGFA